MMRCRVCGAEIEPNNDPVFDEDRQEIVIGSQRRHVPPLLWDILILLRSRIGRTVSREFIVNHAYATRRTPTNAAIYVYIYQLRRLLVGSPYRIVTGTLRGFRFECIPDQEEG
jgi:DNA-binding response OmpR family regulator